MPKHEKWEVKNPILKLPWIIIFAISSLTMESKWNRDSENADLDSEYLVLNAVWQSSLFILYFTTLSYSFKDTVKVNRMFSKELVTIFCLKC